MHRLHRDNLKTYKFTKSSDANMAVLFWIIDRKDMIGESYHLVSCGWPRLTPCGPYVALSGEPRDFCLGNQQAQSICVKDLICGRGYHKQFTQCLAPLSPF